MAGKVTVAVYGLGRQGAAPRLRALLGATERLQLRYVVDKDPAAATEMLDEVLPRGQQPEVIKPWHWDHLCKDKQLDAILVCSTLPGVNMIRKSLRNKKAVMCEHPISLQSAAIKACYEAADKSHTPLMFGFNRRFDQMTNNIRDRVLGGEIGDVYSVRSAACYVPFNPSGRADPSAIFRDCVAEEVDAITWILDETPHTVFATGSGLACNDDDVQGPTDAVALTLRFPSGTLATMDVKKKDCMHENHIEINGSEGVLLVDPHNREGTTIHAITKSGTRTERLTHPRQDRVNNAFAASVKHFVDVVQGKSSAQLTELDTLLATDIAAACLESHNSNTSVARQTERQCKPPEVLLKEPMWNECPNSYNGVMPPLPMAQ